MSDTFAAETWFTAEAAQKIIARLASDDVRAVVRPAVPKDVSYFHGLSSRAEKCLASLGELRTRAVDDACGFSFVETMAPYEQMKAELWLQTDRDVPSVFDVLDAEFLARTRANAA